MSIRASAVGMALLTLLAAASSQRAQAWDLRTHIEQTDYQDLLIAVREAPTGSFLPGIGVNSNAGLTGSVRVTEREYVPACPTLSMCVCQPAAPYLSLSEQPDGCRECADYRRYRRTLADCFLFGISPAALLRPRGSLEFDDQDELPVLTFGQQRIRAGALLWGAAQIANDGCFSPGMLVRGCRQVLASPPAAEPTVPIAAPAVPRTGSFTLRVSPAEFSIDIDIQLGKPRYERLSVKPAEVEELTMPPVEVEFLPVMPVTPEVEPFLPPERGTFHRMPRTIVPEYLVFAAADEPERIPVPAVEVPATVKARKLEKAERWLRKAEKHFLAGRHDEAREQFERVQQGCPGTEYERQATERLLQLAAKEVMDRVTEGVGAGQLEAVPAPKVEPEIEPRPEADRLLRQTSPFPLTCELASMEEEQARDVSVAREVATLLKACEQAIAEGRCCEALDLARKAQILSPKRVAAHPLAKELGLMPEAEVEVLVPRLPAVDGHIVPALQLILTRQLREMVTPRLIIEIEEPATEEQEKRKAPGEAEVPRFFVEPPPARLGLEEQEDCPVCTEMKQLVGQLLGLLGQGTCIELDCTAARARARGQMQLGALKLHVDFVGGQLGLNLDLVPTGPPETASVRSWYQRWLEDAEESEPNRD